MINYQNVVISEQKNEILKENEKEWKKTFL